MPPPTKKARTEDGSKGSLPNKNTKKNAAAKESSDCFASRPEKQQEKHLAKQAQRRANTIASPMGGTSGKIKLVTKPEAAGSAASTSLQKQPPQQQIQNSVTESPSESDGDDEEDEALAAFDDLPQKQSVSSGGLKGWGVGVNPTSFTGKSAPGNTQPMPTVGLSAQANKQLIEQLLQNSKRRQDEEGSEDEDEEEEEDDDVVDNGQDYINLCATKVEKNPTSAAAWFELSLAMADGSAAATMLSGKLVSLLQCHSKAVELAASDEQQLRKAGEVMAASPPVSVEGQKVGKKQLRQHQLLLNEHAAVVKTASEATADAWCNLGASMSSTDTVIVNLPSGLLHGGQPLSQVEVRAISVEKLHGESSFAWNNLAYALVQAVLRPSATVSSATANATVTSTTTVLGQRYDAVGCSIKAVACLTEILEDATPDEMSGPYDTLGVALCLAAQKTATVVKHVHGTTLTGDDALETLTPLDCFLRALSIDKNNLWAWYHLGYFILRTAGAGGRESVTIRGKTYTEAECYAESITKQDEDTKEEFFAELMQQEPSGADYLVELGLAVKPTEDDRQEHDIYMAKTRQQDEA